MPSRSRPRAAPRRQGKKVRFGSQGRELSSAHPPCAECRHPLKICSSRTSCNTAAHAEIRDPPWSASSRTKVRSWSLLPCCIGKDRDPHNGRLLQDRPPKANSDSPSGARANAREYYPCAEQSSERCPIASYRERLA